MVIACKPCKFFSILLHSKNQGILIETIQQENKKYSENKEMEELTKMVKRGCKMVFML
jgi:hypothetical protein